MPEPIITTGAALVGAGAWFADKLFGSSATALGDNLRAYLASRVPTIFAVAGQRAEEKNLDLQPIKPGLLARMVMDASFSEESPEITDWWANLFIDAALKGENRHAVFSDMMAVIGPDEARCLDEFITTFESGKLPAAFSFAPSPSSNMDLGRDDLIFGVLGDSPFPREVVDDLEARMASGHLDWPIRYLSWYLPIVGDGRKATWESKGNPWFYQNRTSLEILERAGVLQSARIEKTVWDGAFWIKTVEPTHLGMAFYLACKGNNF